MKRIMPYVGGYLTSLEKSSRQSLQHFFVRIYLLEAPASLREELTELQYNSMNTIGSDMIDKVMKLERCSSSKIFYTVDGKFLTYEYRIKTPLIKIDDKIFLNQSCYRISMKNGVVEIPQFPVTNGIKYNNQAIEKIIKDINEGFFGGRKDWELTSVSDAQQLIDVLTKKKLKPLLRKSYPDVYWLEQSSCQDNEVSCVSFPRLDTWEGVTYLTNCDSLKPLFLIRKEDC